MVDTIESLEPEIAELWDNFPFMSTCVNTKDYTNQLQEMYRKLVHAQERLIILLKKELSATPAIEIFKQEYDGEGLADVERDLWEAFDPRFNEKAKVIVNDEHNIPKGTFILTLEHIPE